MHTPDEQRALARRWSRSVLPVALVGALACASAATAGPTWDVDYNDDAKATPSTAQPITLNGPVLNITGQLTGFGFDGTGDFVDMYLVDIRTPTLLKMSTVGGNLGGDASFDTQLFLFRQVEGTNGPRALGMLANNDAAQGVTGSFLGSSATDGSGFTLVAPGLYYIAISGLGTNPISATGELIFSGMSFPGAVVFGGERELFDWVGQGATGTYNIRLEAVEGVPAPGALALLCSVLAAPRSRRRGRA